MNFRPGFETGVNGGPTKTGLSASFYEAKSGFSSEQCWSFTPNNVSSSTAELIFIYLLTEMLGTGGTRHDI